MSAPPLQFADFVVSPLELRRDGRRIEIEPRPLALLYYLVAASPRIVPKAELLNEMWGVDTHVTENVISQAVARIREALGDSKSEPRFIRTAPKIGLEFIHQVEPVRPGPVGSKGSGPIHSGDRSEFVRDVNYPDGSVVFVNEVFEKAWEIRNAGSVPWLNRFLARVGPSSAAGRLLSEDRVPIPTTMPGHRCVVSVRLQAPTLPGSSEARWKMIDSAGRLLLPAQEAVYISVDVIERPRHHRGKE